MALVVGSAGSELVHLPGDGLVPLPGYANLAQATAGNDTILAKGGADSVFAGEGNDSIDGGEGDDTINGQFGDDTLSGGSGNDLLIGGTGNDVYVVDSMADQIAEVAGEGTLDRVFASVSFTLAADDDIEWLSARLPAGTAAINLTGNALSQRIDGNAGSNVLSGDGGVDTLFGLDGADTLSGGAGKDLLIGGTGNDTYYVDRQSDQITELAGEGTRDRVLASASFALAANADIEWLSADSASGTASINLAGNDLAQRINGNAGSNVLAGNGGNDQLNGLDGNDTLTGGAGTDLLFGGAGDDRLVIAAASEISGTETYNGGTGRDVLDGMAVVSSVDLSGAVISGVEVLSGFSGGLVLTSGQLDKLNGTIDTGALSLLGAGAVDVSDSVVFTRTINLSAQGNSITLRTGYGTGGGYFYGTVNGGNGNDAITVLDGGPAALETGSLLNGNAGNDSLTGSWDGDTIYGGADYDALKGGGGRDYLFGGLSDDKFVISAASDVVAGEVYDGAIGFDVLDGTGVSGAVDFSATTVTGMSSVIGFSGGLVLTSGQLNQFDRLVDTGTIALSAGGNFNLSNAKVVTNTIILSAAGNGVTLRGGTGYSVGGYFDGAVAGAQGNDTVTILNGGYSGGGTGVFLGGNGGNDSLTGAWDNDTLDGGTDNDTLVGGAGNDLLSGAAGNDSLVGGLGDDSLNGGAGLDRLYGGEGDDRLNLSLSGDIVSGETYDGGLGSDTLDGATIALAVDVSAATITGVESIKGFSGGLALTAGQLDAFTGTIDTGGLMISSAGGVDLSDAKVLTDAILLSGAGNVLTLRGGTGATGGYFDGTVNGSVGNDTVTILDGGAAGNLPGAALYGNGGNDSLTGSWNNDTLYGGDGNDQLVGGGGDDLMFGGLGADSIFGGNGKDTVDYSSATGNLQISIGGQNATESGGVVDVIVGFENATGGSGNDTLVGDLGGNVMLGGGGNDSLQGLAGSDNLTGGLGADFIDAGDGDDTILGEDGNDVLIGGIGADSLFGGNGNDSTIILAAAELIFGDVMSGGEGSDTLTGLNHPGNANLSSTSVTGFEALSGFVDGLTLRSSQAAQFFSIDVPTLTFSDGGIVDFSSALMVVKTINLSAEGSKLTFNAGNISRMTTVNGGLGDDTLTVNDGGTGWVEGLAFFGNGGNDSLTGSFNFDTLYGGDGNDVLSGRNMGDTLAGGAGVDSLYGGGGNDTLVIASATDAGAGEIYDGGNFTSSPLDVDVLDGRSAAGLVDLSGASILRIEKIIGFSGGLVLAPGSLAGVDRLDTGTITFKAPGIIDLTKMDVLTKVINLANGDNTLTIGGAKTNSGGWGYFDGSIFGGSGADKITNLGGYYGAVHNVAFYGNDGNDILTGVFDSEVLSGGNGDDYLSGGDSDDTLLGGAGNDSMYGGAGHDIVDYGQSTTGVLVNLSNNVLGGGAVSDVISGFEGVAGSSSADTLLGNDGANFLSGRGGNDSLVGGNGDDTISGGFGADTLEGGAGIDTLDYHTSGSSLLVNLLTNATSGDPASDVISGFENIIGGFGDDTLVGGVGATIQLEGGAGNDSLSSGSGTDILTGGDGNDTLIASGGSDTLYGGAGNDVMSGGSGADTFNFHVTGAASGNDTITDFTFGTGAGYDVILLTNGGFVPNYLGTGNFTGHSWTEVRFTAGHLSVDYDGNGVEDFTITIQGMTSASQIVQANLI